MAFPPLDTIVASTAPSIAKGRPSPGGKSPGDEFQRQMHMRAASKKQGTRDLNESARPAKAFGKPNK